MAIVRITAEELRNNIEIENDYSQYIGVVQANKAYLDGLIYEAEKYVVDTYNEYVKNSDNKFLPTVSFSGGKDSTVVSRIVRDALQNNSIIHLFGDSYIIHHASSGKRYFFAVLYRAVYYLL